MKFSYPIFKKLLPSLRSPQHLANLLTMHLFEIERIEGDSLDIKILANRYSDAACYWGMATVVAAAMGKQFKMPASKVPPIRAKRDFKVEVQTKLCRRMCGRYFAEVQIGPSPDWLVKALEASGMRSKNNLVDITNYVTMETGQPLHAFDFDHLADSRGSNADVRGNKDTKSIFGSKTLFVRQARKGEKMITLDGETRELDSKDMVLADAKDALDVAGIKGGTKAEITEATKTVLLTAGNFDGVSIYKTSRKLGLRTDASLRFSHDISPELVSRGIARATELIAELCKGKMGATIDVYLKPPSRQLVKFDAERFEKLTGLAFPLADALALLERLGFVMQKKSAKSAVLEIPPIRTDISAFEDLAEEVLAIRGYENVSVTPPHVMLHPGHEEPEIHFRERVKRILPALGLSEVLNYSFAARGDVEVENPIAEDKRFLRDSLMPGLVKNAEDNLRFFGEVRIFETGHVFKHSRGKDPVKETEKLGIALAAKKQVPLLEAKGVIETLCERLGIPRVHATALHGGVYQIEADHRELGLMKILKKPHMAVAVAELDLATLRAAARGDDKFKPLPKFPAVARDISIKVSKSVRTGDLLQTIESTAGFLPDGAEVVDFYEGARLGPDKQGMTFRLKFRAEDRTLTDKEVDAEIKKVVEMLREKFEAEMR